MTPPPSNKTFVNRFSHHRHAASGFTLIEILMVVVVLGLVASVAVVNLGSGNQLRELENHARTVYVLLQAASDQAVMNNQEVGFTLLDKKDKSDKQKHYGFLFFNEEKRQWEEPPGTLLHGGVLPEWVNVDLKRDDSQVLLGADTGSQTGEELPMPQVALLSSGEITPFELLLFIEGKPEQTYRIVSDGINGMTWFQPGEVSEP